MHLFQSHHVKLLNSCYPPSSVLLTAGPDYSPNSHELSRLTYYAYLIILCFVYIFDSWSWQLESSRQIG